MTTLSLKTKILLRELAHGNVTAEALGNLRFASFGQEEQALLEQKLYLADELQSARPEVLSRFVLPAATHIRKVKAAYPFRITRHQRPETISLDVTAVILPTKDERGVWVFLPDLESTFYVAADADLDGEVRAEFLRLVFARELSPLEVLDLFPPEASRLVDLHIGLDASEDTVGKRERERRASTERARKILESVGREVKKPRAMRPMLGRDAELEQLTKTLSGGDFSVLLSGPASVGKTALFRAWLANLDDGPTSPLVYETSGAELIAGMSGLGQWQERIRRVMLAAETLGAIVYFPNLQDLFSERAFGIDLPRAMRGFLEDGRVRIVGEITDEHREALKIQHGAFFSAFVEVRLEPMQESVRVRGVGTSEAILVAAVAADKRHEPHRVELDPAAIPTLIDLAERYLPYDAFPGKAVNLYDELRTAHEGKAMRARIDKNDVYAWFSVRTGIRTFLLRDDESLRKSEVVAFLDERLVGQEKAKAAVASTVCTVKAGLQPSGKPLSTFLFVGPTGVGKTELAKALAAYLFGREDRLVRFDMSEFQDPSAAMRLIHGSDSGEGLLTRRVRQEPFCVVLLDEIEKAHPAVFDLLLQVCGEGRLTDARGKTAYLHNAIVILTSNLGASHRASNLGFAAARTAPDARAHAEAHDRASYMRIIEQSFRPEFVNRIDQVVPFAALQREDVEAVVRALVARTTRRRGFLQATTTLDVSPSAVSMLAIGGFSETYGARAMRRHVDERLVGPVAELLSTAKNGPKRLLVRVPSEDEVTAAPDAFTHRSGLAFSLIREGDGATPSFAWPVRVARLQMSAELRRASDVDDLRAEVDMLEVEVADARKRTQGVAKPRSSRRSKEALEGDLVRFQSVLRELDEAVGDLEALEELAMRAVIAGEASGDLERDVPALVSRFRRALFRTMVCRDSRRFGITLMCQELDAGEGFRVWLVPLLETLKQRRADVTVHFEGDHGDATWPKKCRFGPGRTLEEAQRRLDEPVAAPRCILLRAHGENLGICLGLEAGLHRYPPYREHTAPTHVHIARIAFRAALREDDFLAPTLKPLAPHEFEHATKLQPVRQLENNRMTLCLGKGHSRQIQRSAADDLEGIALEYLLLIEQAGIYRDAYLSSLFTNAHGDIEDIVHGGDVAAALAKYRERTGATAEQAREYIEAVRSRRA